MFEYETKTNGTYHVATKYSGDLTHVDVTHLPSGIHARGNSKKYAGDTYSKGVGYNLAYYRALERLAHKVTRHLIHSLPVTV